VEESDGKIRNNKNLLGLLGNDYYNNLEMSDQNSKQTSGVKQALIRRLTMKAGKDTKMVRIQIRYLVSH
jgi:hypothetical protein